MRLAVRTMTVMLLTLLLASASGRVYAQANVSAADIERLQLGLKDAADDVTRLRGRDAARAAKLQKELDELGDEATYLRVKVSKEGNVPRSEYSSLRDRIDDLRSRARVDAPPPAATGVEIPVGRELDVRLQTVLTSATAEVEDRFEATTVADLARDGRVIIPAGSVVRGIVRAVDKAGRADRKGSLTLAFDRIAVRGKEYTMRATVTEAIESEGIKGEVGKIGGTAVAGAIIGGILGGGKGALLGAMIGGGGVIAATPGKDVELPAGTILRIRLDSPLTIQ